MKTALRILTAIGTYVQQSKKELSVVVWPSATEWKEYTITVVAFLVVVASFVAALDFAFTRAALTLFS